MTLSRTSERQFLSQLIPGLMSGDSRIRIGPGDDAAVVCLPPDHDLVVTCDMLVEGVHFRQQYFTWEELGAKAITASVSDLAAMGAEPAWALVSLGLPSHISESDAGLIMQGMIRSAASSNLSIIGGDTVRAPVIVIDVFAAGLCRSGQAITRSGAGIGDVLVVTGDLGASAAGLAVLSQSRIARSQYKRLIDAHCRPTARLSAARALTRAVLPTAMIDISDGLASEVIHICTASGVGARLVGDRIPIGADTRAAAGDLGLDPFDLVLSGGEDYQLLAALSPDQVSTAIAAVDDAGDRLTVIGTLVPPEQGISVEIRGIEQPMSRYPGYDAFAASDTTSGLRGE